MSIKDDPVEFMNMIIDEMAKIYPWQEKFMRQLATGRAAAYVTPTGRVTFPKMEVQSLGPNPHYGKSPAQIVLDDWAGADYSEIEQQIVEYYRQPEPKTFVEPAYVGPFDKQPNRKERRAQAARARHK